MIIQRNVIYQQDYCEDQLGFGADKGRQRRLKQGYALVRGF